LTFSLLILVDGLILFQKYLLRINLKLILATLSRLLLEKCLKFEHFVTKGN